MSREVWPQDMLDDVLMRGARRTVTIELTSPRAAQRLRFALYKRRRTTPAAVTIGVTGATVTVAPLRDPIIRMTEGEATT